MSRATIIGIIIAVIVVGGGAALLIANHNSNSNQTNSTTSTSSSDQSMNSMDMNKNSTTAPTSSTPAATNSVVIENFAFSPADITVKKGTTVSWTNKDSATHTVTENDGKTGPDSGNLATGKSYSFTYNTVGTFKYHCAIHPNMVGTVTVTE
jgi:plastocyanin